ncbi:MAG: precorrin-8X methylmutase [Desulfobacterales bacterium]|nr:precorrin-8X methylmutase [Desulfobacterales bacterium]MBS3754881.1 precorrin-8X methylmutase [Desulfobacterales bacterium]
MKPHEIENQSFAIIAQEAGDHGFDPDQWQVVSRMIHTSADFDYLQTVRFHPDAIASGIKAAQNGCAIITDTHMATAGIRKTDAAGFGCRVKCFINDPKVVEAAGKQGTTRAAAAVDAAVEGMTGGIYVIGNAPTALLRLIEQVRSGRAAPALVVGLPVGFVKAAESKQLLAGTDLPHITNAGRKGGSAVAAAVVNALLGLASAKGA